MPKQVRLRRGTTVQHAVFTGALGEVTFDTDRKSLVCHDGATPGGFPLAHRSAVPTGRLLWVDGLNGDDAAALNANGGFGLFKTLTAAKNAAVAGDTIQVLPGTYDERNLLKDGVNWHFLSGARVVNTLPGSGAIFDDGTHGTNSAVVCRITGDGEFVNDNTELLSWVILIGQSGTDVSMEARLLGAATRGCVRLSGGKGRLHVRTIASGGLRAVELYSGTNFVRADEIVSNGGHAIELGGGLQTVEVNTISSTAGAAVHGIGGTSHINAREIHSSVDHGLLLEVDEDPVVVTVNGARIVSEAPSAAARAVEIIGSDDLTLKDCVLIAPGSALASIDADAPVDVRLYGSTMANRAAGGNVTFLTGGARFEVSSEVI